MMTKRKYPIRKMHFALDVFAVCGVGLLIDVIIE